MKPPTELALSSQRLRLKFLLDHIFAKVPDPTVDFDKALNLGLVGYAPLSELYDELFDFLADEENSRIVLYLPIELLPNFRTIHAIPMYLRKKQMRFTRRYLKTWHQLLLSGENDLRTNFIDGDVWEPELGENPRVRKAAHLIPDLVERGLISTDEIIRLSKETTDKILRESIEDTLPILVDRKLITGDFPVRPKFTRKPIPANPSKALLARIAWEKQEETNQGIEISANNLSDDLSAKYVNNDQCGIKIDLDNRIMTLIVIRGIGKYIEKMDKENHEKSKKNAKSFLELFLTLWKKDTIEIKNELISVLSHWLSLGIIDENDLAAFGLKKPDLESTSDQNLINELTAIIEKIKSDSRLSKLLYPIIIGFGSKIKGYGKLSADLDVGVFVRPETSWDQRRVIYAGLGKVTEFWLQDKDELLEIKEVPLPENNIAEKDWLHILLQGVWFGEDSEIKDFQKKIFPEYFGTKDRTKRTLWLRQMELEALQYRLMHKGYARFYPLVPRAETEHSYLIDSGSVFWDPGYRRLATKLFITRVFLPDMSSLKN